MLFARTSVIPTLSSTARMAPPAFTPAAAEFGHLFVGNGAFVDGYADKILLSGLNALGDGGLHFVCFAETPAYDAVFVAYHYDGGEGEGASALGHLGDAVDGYEAVFEFEVAGRLDSIVSFCHSYFRI